MLIKNIHGQMSIKDILIKHFSYSACTLWIIITMISRGLGDVLCIIPLLTANFTLSAPIIQAIHSGIRLKNNMWKAIKVSICFSLILFLFYSTAAALDNAIREVTAEEKQKIFERLKEIQKDMSSMHATVSQEKQLSVLKKKIQAKGTIIMAKPNMLRWEVTKPEKSITVIDGETMTIYHPDAREAQVYNLSDNLLARNTMSFFATAMGGNLNEMEKKFTVTVFRNDGKIVFKLIPLSSIARKYLSGIAVYYDEATGLPGGFEVTTTKGDKTITKLADIKINPEIRSDAFELKMPGDVWITNKAENINN